MIIEALKLTRCIGLEMQAGNLHETDTLLGAVSQMHACKKDVDETQTFKFQLDQVSNEI